MIKKQLEIEIKNIIQQTLGLNNVDLSLEHPAHEGFGDFSSSVAIRISKSLGQSPEETAKSLIEKLYESQELKKLGLEKIEVAGPGFINFYLKKDILVAEVKKILSEGQNYGRSGGLTGKKIMIEFGDPNPFKEIHIGHLRNLAIGQALIRLLESQGAQVRAVNYEGDVGLHVAKCLWGLIKSSKISTQGGSASGGRNQKSKLEDGSLLERIKFLGQCYVAGSKAYEESESVKKEIAQINVAVYNQDSSQPEILALWQVGRALSLEYFGTIYSRLGTKYDHYYFEGEVAGKGRDLVLSHIEDGVFQKSQEAVIFEGEKYGLHTRVFVTQEGYATYEAKDMALAPLKYSDYKYDLSIILTGDEQAEYFKVVLKALSLIYSDLAAKTLNETFGMVNLKGEKMTSRKGNVITAEQLLNEAKVRVRQIINLSNLGNLGDLEREKIAEKVAVGAVKYSLLKSEKSKPIMFDLAESVALEGNSGPYLQYTYARAKSVLRKSVESGKWKVESYGNFQLSTLNSQLSSEELSILRTLYKFPEVVEAAASKYAPHLICNFLFDLAQKFNLFYNNVSILDSKLSTFNSQLSTTNLRLALTATVAQVLKNGLYLLGIDAPERM